MGPLGPKFNFFTIDLAEISQWAYLNQVSDTGTHEPLINIDIFVKREKNLSIYTHCCVNSKKYLCRFALRARFIGSVTMVIFTALIGVIIDVDICCFPDTQKVRNQYRYDCLR